MRSDVVTSKSIVSLACIGNKLSKLKLDSRYQCGHTLTSMISSARALEIRTPLAAQLLVLGLVILTVIVILPR